MKKYEGLTFRFNSLNLTKAEFGFDDIPKEGTKCEILSIEVQISEEFKDNYFNIQMETGEVLSGISGEHLTLI